MRKHGNREGETDRERALQLLAGVHNYIHMFVKHSDNLKGSLMSPLKSIKLWGGGEGETRFEKKKFIFCPYNPAMLYREHVNTLVIKNCDN